MQTVRIRKITIPLTMENDLTLSIEDTLNIADLKKLICKELHVKTSLQKLYYGGKELMSSYSLSDYNVNNNDVIQLMVKINNGNNSRRDSEDSTTSIELTTATSLYYKNGDAIDVIFKELGAWFEAKIVGIFVEQNKDSVNEEDLIFQVVMDRDEETAPINMKFGDIRPRAMYLYEKSELKPTMVVFVNYNIKNPKEIGYWYDFHILKVDHTKNVLQGTLLLGEGHELIYNCNCKFIDEVMRIEQPVCLSERINQINEIPLRKLPLYCKKCKDVSAKDCKECSCNICGKKNSVDKLIICDECEYTYHLFCLEPPLLEVPPEPEWYCPDCKNDENEIVKAGEKLKSLNKKCRQKSECEKSYFGPILGIDVGTCWSYKSQVFESGIHGIFTSDIHGGDDGVYSIVLHEGHEVYRDDGHEFYYTICDGRGPSKRKNISTTISLQRCTKMTNRLTLNCNNYKTKNCVFGKADFWKHGKPIRVIRCGNMENYSKFTPKTGYRYDGIYKVVEYFPDIDASGCIVWRFLMRRDDPTPPPWTSIKQKFNPETKDINPNKKAKTENFQIDPIITKVINDDFANERLWDECKKAADQGKQQFVDKVKEMFTCVCCQDIVYMPVTTSCKHNICCQCLKKCLSWEIYHCPCCRLELPKKHVPEMNRKLSTALKLLFPGYGFTR